MTTFKKGDKVTYKTPFKTERGIVKSLSSEGFVFVVYNCAEEWSDYENYTAARTAIKDLYPGWEIQ